jgi:hypothetical protein
MNEYYILFGKKDNNIYYVCNTNPILWSPVIQQAKIYTDRYAAEYAVLRDWYNFRHISDNIDNGSLDSFWIAIMNINTEVERLKLLGD